MVMSRSFLSLYRPRRPTTVIGVKLVSRNIPRNGVSNVSIPGIWFRNRAVCPFPGIGMVPMRPVVPSRSLTSTITLVAWEDVFENPQTDRFCIVIPSGSFRKISLDNEGEIYAEDGRLESYESWLLWANRRLTHSGHS